MVIDADVLYGATTRALLIYLDFHDLVRVHWSPLLVDEMSRALVKTGRKTAAAARRDEALMGRAAPGAAVPTLEVHASFKAACPGVRDAKDLHVAACAVALLDCGYYPTVRTMHLVTRNARDFARKRLADLHVCERHPDAFLLDLWTEAPQRVADAFRLFRGDLPSAPTVEALLEKLSNDGQKKTAAALSHAHASGAALL